MDPCRYVSATSGVHDERWLAALRALRFDPQALIADPVKDVGLASLREAIAGGQGPVLAGPLEVARHLIDIHARLIGLSWGYDLHDLSSEGDLSWLPRLDHLIVDSAATRDIAIDSGMKLVDITVLPWGIDLSEFPFRAAEDASLPQEAVVLSLRAHEPRYRVNEILDAVALLQTRGCEVSLTVGHSGSLTHALREQATALGIKVEWVDTMPEGELPDLFDRVSVYVTAAEVDGTSVTLLQAMASGVPVVASDAPGNLAWVTEGVTGWVFPVGDTAALADAIQRALDDAPRTVDAAKQRVHAEADWQRNLPRLRTAMDGS